MKSIDLAMKGLGGMMPSMPEKDEACYPEFHYCGDQKLDLPDEGTMEIKFRKLSEEERTGRDGEKRYSCTVEVRVIEKINGSKVEAPATSGEGGKTEAALDGLLKALKSKHEESDDY